MPQYNINDFYPRTGQEIKSDGTTVNEADGINVDGSQNEVIAGNKPYYIVLVETLSKRDTNQIITPVITLDGLKAKRVFLNNTLNQGFNITAQYSRDGGTNWIQIGSAKTLAATSGVTVYIETDFTALNMYKGQVRFTIDTFTAAPTSGTLIMDFQGSYI